MKVKQNFVSIYICFVSIYISIFISLNSSQTNKNPQSSYSNLPNVYTDKLQEWKKINISQIVSFCFNLTSRFARKWPFNLDKDTSSLLITTKKRGWDVYRVVANRLKKRARIIFTEFQLVPGIALTIPSVYHKFILLEKEKWLRKHTSVQHIIDNCISLEFADLMTILMSLKNNGGSLSFSISYSYLFG